MDCTPSSHDYFALQLDATTTFSNEYFGARSPAAQEAVASTFETFTKGFKDFETGNVKDIGALNDKVEVMNAQLQDAKKYILPAISAGRLGTNSELAICQNLLAASGQLATATEVEKAKAEVEYAAARAEFGKAVGVLVPSMLISTLKAAASKDMMVDATGREAMEGKFSIPLANLVEENDKSIGKALTLLQKNYPLVKQWSSNLDAAVKSGEVSKDDAEPVLSAIAVYKENVTKENFDNLSQFQYILESQRKNAKSSKDQKQSKPVKRDSIAANASNDKNQ